MLQGYVLPSPVVEHSALMMAYATSRGDEHTYVDTCLGNLPALYSIDEILAEVAATPVREIM